MGKLGSPNVKGRPPRIVDGKPLGGGPDPLVARWYHIGRPWNDTPGLIYAGSEDPHVGTFVADCGSWSDEIFFGERPTLDVAAVADGIVRDHNAALPRAALDSIEEGSRAEGLAEACGLLSDHVDVLAAAMNDAQIEPQEMRLGRDLRVPARRIAEKYDAAQGAGQ